MWRAARCTRCTSRSRVHSGGCTPRWTADRISDKVSIKADFLILSLSYPLGRLILRDTQLQVRQPSGNATTRGLASARRHSSRPPLDCRKNQPPMKPKIGRGRSGRRHFQFSSGDHRRSVVQTATRWPEPACCIGRLPLGSVGGPRAKSSRASGRRTGQNCSPSAVLFFFFPPRLWNC